MIVVREYRPAAYDAVIHLWQSVGLPVRPVGRDSRSNIQALLGDSRRAFLLLAWDVPDRTEDIVDGPQRESAESAGGTLESAAGRSALGESAMGAAAGESAAGQSDAPGEAEARLVGTVLGTNDGRKGWINRLAVAEGYQGKGWGRRLVAEAEALFRNEGIEVFAALIEGDNRLSLSFFSHIGYAGGGEIVYVSRRLRSDA